MITLLLKSSVVIILLLAFYKLFLEKESFFAVNRLYLLACLGLAGLLPFVALPKLVNHQGVVEAVIQPIETTETLVVTQEKRVKEVQSLSIEQNTRTEIAKPITNEPAVLANITKKTPIIIPPTIEKETGTASAFILTLQAFSLSDWGVLFYFFGVIILSLNLIAQLGSMVLRIVKNTDKIKDDDGIIVNMNAVIEPCSFFNYIFINPASYDFDTYEQIIAHEKIHVAKGHTFDLLLAELAVVALWFNPFIWLFRKEVEKNIEYQTDALLVKNEPQQKEGYQMNLLKIATYNKPLTIVTNYNQSLIKQRILKMNSKQSTPYSYWKYAFIAPLLFLTLLFINKPQVAFAKGNVIKTAGNIAPEMVNEVNPKSSQPQLEDEKMLASIAEERVKEEATIVENQPPLTEAINKITSNTKPIETAAKDLSTTAYKTLTEAYKEADCEALEKAAKAGDKEVVKKLLLNYTVNCLSTQSEDQIDNLDLIKDLANREAEIYLEAKTGNITLRGTSFTIWSDARHKAYKKANKQSNINNPIRHPELDKAVMESNELQAIQIIKNLDPKYLVYKEAKHLAHLDYMKYILNNGGKLTTSKTTVYIKHDADEFYVKQDEVKDKEVKITYQDSDDRNSSADCTELLTATSRENITMVKTLLKNIDPNCIDPNPGYDTRELENGMTWRRLKPQTPLVAAARMGNLTIGKLLVEAGAKVNLHGKRNEPPLIAAAEIGNTEFTKYLLNKGADLSYNSNAYGSALNAAARGGHTETMAFLLKAGADIDASTNGQGTPLNAAARHGHIAAMKLLIDNGANINAQNNGQGSALNAAARHGHLAAVELLLAKGAAIDAATNGQGSALNAAARHGNLAEVRLLLAKGADINEATNGQGSALNAAVRHGHLDIIKFLLEKGADIDAQTNGQGSALNAAVRHGHLDIIKFLLEKGADIDAQTNGQGSALNAAARHGHLDIIKFLLEKGADIDAQTNGQGSALNAAARHGHLDIIKFLLEKGANIDAQTNGQGSALNAAARHGHLDIIKFLVTKGADVDQQNNGQGSVLNAAARHGHLDIVQFLVKEGAVINAHTNGQGTAILKAAQHGNYQIVKFLLENGADPYLGNGGQRSAMEYARRENNQQLLNLLKAYNKAH